MMEREVVSPPPVRRSWLTLPALATAAIVTTLCSLVVMITLADTEPPGVRAAQPRMDGFGNGMSIGNGTVVGPTSITPLTGNGTIAAPLEPTHPIVEITGTANVAPFNLADIQTCAGMHVPQCTPFVGCYPAPTPSPSVCKWSCSLLSVEGCTCTASIFELTADHAYLDFAMVECPPTQ